MFGLRVLGFKRIFVMPKFVAPWSFENGFCIARMPA
jgi:hypothetical protein